MHSCCHHHPSITVSQPYCCCCCCHCSFFTSTFNLILSQSTELSLLVGCCVPDCRNHNKATMNINSSHSQSFRAASSSLGLSEGEEKKECHHEEDVDDHVDPDAAAAAFDDILTTVRKEEWYTVRQL
jgi:hypothetical protein